MQIPTVLGVVHVRGHIAFAVVCMLAHFSLPTADWTRPPSRFARPRTRNRGRLCMGSRAHTALYNRGTIDTTTVVSCVFSPLYVHSNDRSVDTSFAATPMAHRFRLPFCSPRWCLHAQRANRQRFVCCQTSVFIRRVPKRKFGARKAAKKTLHALHVWPGRKLGAPEVPIW